MCLLNGWVDVREPELKTILTRLARDQHFPDFLLRVEARIHPISGPNALDHLERAGPALVQRSGRQDARVELDAVLPPQQPHGGQLAPVCWSLCAHSLILSFLVVLVCLADWLDDGQIAEHYLFDGHDQETWSYYGPLNILCYNVCVQFFTVPCSMR